MEARVSEPAQKLQTILIVDDEPSIRLLFRSALQSLPARILEADNGLEAMSLIEQEKPALVVTDYAMPDWDGLEVCHQIRKRPEIHGFQQERRRGLARDQHDLDVLQVGTLADLVADFEPVPIGHRVVGHDEGGFLLLDQAHRLEAIVSLEDPGR